MVVLDRDLPELHGDEVCRRLSGDERETKVLMLTAADGLDDVVDGLTLGADDYLPKPFEWKELVARIRALARRAGRARPAVLRRGDLELDPARRSVTRAGAELDLTPKEFGVLEALHGGRRRRRLRRGRSCSRCGTSTPTRSPTPCA